MLSLIMLINRSGTMVLPFLSVYLTRSLGYSVEETGIILSSYGLGSLAGGYIGGQLTDRYGHFVVQFLSLLISAILFVILSYLTEYYQLLAGFLSLVWLRKALDLPMLLQYPFILNLRILRAAFL